MKFKIGAKSGNEKRFAYVDSIEEAEKWIDEKYIGGGPDNRILVRHEIQKKKGRLTPDSPLIDVWTTSDMLCTRPFEIFIVKTEDLKGKSIQRVMNQSNKKEELNAKGNERGN